MTSAPLAIGLLVGPVTVPESLDRPQLVVRISPTEQRVLEQRRWIQSFDREIRGALVADLTRRLPGTEVAALGQNVIARPTWRVLVDIDRFEADPARGVWLQARWALRDPDDHLGAARSFALQVDRPVGTGEFDSLVEAAARALDGLAGAITDGLRGAVAAAAVAAPIRAPNSSPIPAPVPAPAPGPVTAPPATLPLSDRAPGGSPAADGALQQDGGSRRP